MNVDGQSLTPPKFLTCIVTIEEASSTIPQAHMYLIKTQTLMYIDGYHKFVSLKDRVASSVTADTMICDGHHFALEVKGARSNWVRAHNVDPNPLFV